MLIHVGIGSYFGWQLSKLSVHGATQKWVGVDTQSSKSFLFREKRTFFFSDPPHLVKTARNCLASNKRSLWVYIYRYCTIARCDLRIMSMFYFYLQRSAIERISPGAT